MIHLVIDSARKSEDQSNAGRWVIQHPSNGSILAYCDTEAEADRVIASLATMGREFECDELIARARKSLEWAKDAHVSGDKSGSVLDLANAAADVIHILERMRTR